MSTEKKTLIEHVLVFVLVNNRTHVLTIFGKKGMNALGGKVLENETPEGAAVREVYEETGGVVRIVERTLNNFASIVGDCWCVHCYAVIDHDGQYFPAPEADNAPIVLASTTEGDVTITPISKALGTKGTLLRFSDFPALLGLATISDTLLSPVIIQRKN